MPKFLFRGSYTPAGAAGVLKEGGTARAAAVARLTEGLGGTVEANYWAFGEDDFFIIVDLPDAAAAAAASLTVGASGAVRVTTTQLMTASDLDEVTRRSVDYRAPGA